MRGIIMLSLVCSACGDPSGATDMGVEGPAATTACSIRPSLHASDPGCLGTWTRNLMQSPAICASRLHSTSAIPAQEAPMHLVAPRTVGSKRHLEPRLEAAQQLLRQLPNSGRAQRGPQLAEVQPPHFGRVALGYQVVSGRVRRQEVRQPTTRHVGCCAHVPSCRSPRAVAHVTVPAKPDET